MSLYFVKREDEFGLENLDLIQNLTIYRPVEIIESVDVKKEAIIENKNLSTHVKVNNNSLSAVDSHLELEIEDIRIIKINGAMGLSIVGGGSIPCHPFGINEPGIFISKIAPDGAASRTNLRIGDRILKVNDIDITGASHDETVEELKRFLNEVKLTVRHDPQPSGLMEIDLIKSHPEETLGIRIHGGIENKSANPYDSTDEGIFVIDVIPDTIAHRDTRLKIGTRIIEVKILLIFLT